MVAAARRVAVGSRRDAGPSADDAVRAIALWRAVLARSPAADELRSATAWLAEEARRDAALPQPVGLDRWERLAQAVLATAEFQFYD